MRELIKDQLEKAILGPYDGENEILKINPFQFYFTGILYPQSSSGSGLLSTNEAALDSDLINNSEDRSRSGENVKPVKLSAEEDTLNEEILSTDFNPSALGLSFSVLKKESFVVTISFGKYYEIKKEDETTKKNKIESYQRKQFVFNVPVSIDGIEIYADHNSFNGDTRKSGIRVLNLINKDHNLKLQLVVREVDSKNIVTVSLVSETKVDSGKSVRDLNGAIFQVGIKVENQTESVFLPFSDKSDFSKIADPEEVEIKLLYKDYMNFASGHGVSVTWSDLDRNKDLKKNWVATSYIPLYEVMSNDFNPKELKDENALDILFIKPLAGKSFSEDGLEMEEMCEKLEAFIKVYDSWITTQREELLDSTIDRLPLSDINKRILKERSRVNLEKCKVLYQRMYDGIQLLRKKEKCFEAFCDANRAMYMQRYMGSYISKKKKDLDSVFIWPGENDEKLPDYSKGISNEGNPGKPFFAKWRPFQLAFLLSQIVGLEDSESDEREQVDLIWFSTGGGKTEAYLGLIAMYLFYRRLRHEANPDQGAGVSVFMRYTLRLLIKDQYNRAIPLILACDLIRKEKSKSYGQTPYSIGIWVGQSLTPNKNFEKNSQDDTRLFCTSVDYMLLDKPEKAKYKLPIDECPCCGTKIERINIKVAGYKGKWGIKGVAKKDGSQGPPYTLFCTNVQCEFTLEKSTYGFPIYHVDEDIYRVRPSLVFSTIDKFASLNWNEDSFHLFNFEGHADSLKRTNDPPELIIQDELHLISSALGTIYGVYEIGINELMSRSLDEEKTFKPKIIAATATAKHAERQCRILYGRKKFSQFPPPGISADDSFFARKEEKTEKSYGRLYVGVQPTGYTNTTAQVRLVSLFNQLLPKIDMDNKEFDKYCTSLIYFNTVKELGKFRTLVMDDISVRSKALADLFGSIHKGHKEDEFFELSSQMKPEDITKNLNALGTNKLYTIEPSLFQKGIRKYSDFLGLNENKRKATFLRLFDSKDEFELLSLKYETEGDSKELEEQNFQTLFGFFEEKERNVLVNGSVPNIVAATNMVSVGIDIARFNVMQITGQPKSHAEYIQASSRAGRTYPGIVITTFNPAKNRDRSHYEAFVDYHQAFYKHVESTSVTPYSEPALEKALDASVFFLAEVFKYRLEHNVKGKVIADGSSIEDFIDQIASLIEDRIGKTGLDYAGIKDRDLLLWNENVVKALQSLKEYWEFQWQSKQGKLFYPDNKSFVSNHPYLNENMNNCLYAGSDMVISTPELKGKRGVMNSLRNVELQCSLQIGDNIK
jgi:hypothetical protein